MRYCRDGKGKDSLNKAGIPLVAASAIFSNQSRWPVLRSKDDSDKGYIQCILLKIGWMSYEPNLSTPITILLKIYEE